MVRTTREQRIQYVVGIPSLVHGTGDFLISFPPKSPVILHSQRRPFCSRLLAFGDTLETSKHVLAAAVSWCWWCQRHVAHIFRVFVNAAFPSHTFREELKTLRAEVKNLEREVAKLRSILQNESTAASAGSPPCQLSPNLLSASPAHTQLGVTQPSPLSSQKLEIPTPPPPPPPPPPPAPASLGFKRRSDTKPVPLKKDVPLQITPQDLLNVKLKKTKSEPGMDKKMSPFKGGISLQDLQRVRLQSKAPQPLPRLANLLNTPSKDGLDFRKHLKKVAIERSPGGTPMNNKENIETGTGLTPLMTQALRRKFQLAHPKSPSPSCLPTRNSFEEQN
ncbi:proline-rich protein 11-like [Crotalus adamanteus]|uniref:Proline-rich protein 11-like n=1 Tax=Crotalus adamanteus TaxID=8729 RepID=A0AAW1CDW7_CROAD